MSYSDGLRQLAAVVEALEDSGADIVSARPERPVDAADDAFRVELRVDLPLDEPLTGGVLDGSTRGSGEHDEHDRPRDDRSRDDRSPPGPADGGEANDDGEEHVGSDDPAAGTPDRTDGTAGGDDGVVCRAPDCERVFGSEHGMKIHFTKMHGAATPGEAGAAPYRDPERLRAAYEATGSFAAMRDELGVDVSPETVRRYAVEYGIHERAATPSAGEGDEGERGTNAGSDSPPDSDPTPLAPDVTTRTDLTPAVRRTPGGDADRKDGRVGRDGPVLPDGLTLADLKETVRTSHTLHEASRSLGLDRDRTTDLLDELDLLDLVHGRVATKERRDELKADIDDRLGDGRAGPSLST